MAARKDYIPESDGAFNGWLTNLVIYVILMAGGGTWTHISPEEVTTLSRCLADWRLAYAAALEARNRGRERSKKNKARKATALFIREFFQKYLGDSPVSDLDRLAMGLPNPDPARACLGEPKARALPADGGALGGFEIELRLRGGGVAECAAVPYRISGCFLHYAWGPEKLLNRTLMSETCPMTHTPFLLSLPPEAAGNYLSCYTRWQNETGRLGKPGVIQHTLIA
jgi:hypothetical protein